MELYQHEVTAEGKKRDNCRSRISRDRNEGRRRFITKTASSCPTARGKKKTLSQSSPSLPTSSSPHLPSSSFFSKRDSRVWKKSHAKEEEDAERQTSFSGSVCKRRSSSPSGGRRRSSCEGRGGPAEPARKADNWRRKRRESRDKRGRGGWGRPSSSPSLLRKELPSSLLFLVAVVKRLERCIMRLVGLCDEYCRGKLAFFVEVRNSHRQVFACDLLHGDRGRCSSVYSLAAHSARKFIFLRVASYHLRCPHANVMATAKPGTLMPWWF